jgi:Na+-transporting NADH:ubiquinone oxidoreductase subunit C
MDRYGDSHIIESLGQNVCNAKNPLWQVDAGIFDKKTLLPITGITYKGVEFEGQQTKINVGPLTCHPPANQYDFRQHLATIEQKTDDNLNAFEIKLNKELKKPSSEQRFPMYEANVEGEKFYIVPLRGAGLWNAIWGYIALEEDKNTIKGAVFDHVGETAGLGAEITQQWFQNRFLGEKVFDKQGNLVGINVSKTNNDPKDLDKNDHEVDAISGATITGDGVTNMIIERLTHYLPYLKAEEQIVAIN